MCSQYGKQHSVLDCPVSPACHGMGPWQGFTTKRAGLHCHRQLLTTPHVRVLNTSSRWSVIFSSWHCCRTLLYHSDLDWYSLASFPRREDYGLESPWNRHQHEQHCYHISPHLFQLAGSKRCHSLRPYALGVDLLVGKYRPSLISRMAVISTTHRLANISSRSCYVNHRHF